MRKYIITLAIITITTAAIFGQENKEDKYEQMRALQVAFVTEKLSLTPAESQKFWPIQNAYKDKERALKDKFRQGSNESELSDKEALVLLENRLSIEEEMLALKREYIEDLKPILTPKRVVKLFSIEHEFKRKMLKGLRDKRKK
ncbi:hypothetical protein [Portibacter lacus]|uniref:Sensor of ECF-type sigma factor n=1 Tax=Portibacter lacus TaxID=1099794 RepID=A0AA37WEB1_9BACT|nr:hypothetical protein [Portibacter lacus]GLR17818.1 hypothetical protein GCM10007940_24330 [Portibacter lacus]